MIRLMGALLVIGSAGAMGYLGASALKRRARVIEGLILSLQLMESEICSRMTPMREVLEMLSSSAPQEVRGLYRRAVGGMSALGRCSFYTIWKNAVADSRELRLRPEESELVSELGLCLGRYDVHEQAAAIDRLRRRLELILKRAEAERDRDCRLHAFLGLASGIFAVIILL